MDLASNRKPTGRHAPSDAHLSRATDARTTLVAQDSLFDRWSVLLLPGLIALTAVFFLPMLLLASNSFHANAGLATISPAWTLDNYITFVTDPFYLGVLLDTFVLGTIVVSI